MKDMRNEFTAIVEQDGPWYIAYCAGRHTRGMPREPERSDLPDPRLQAGGVAAVVAPRGHAGTRRGGMKREIWENPRTGHAEAVPRQTEVANLLARKICRRLAIPDPPG